MGSYRDNGKENGNYKCIGVKVGVIFGLNRDCNSETLNWVAVRELQFKLSECGYIGFRP